MIRLRPYKKDDARTILSWCNDEKAFYKWTAGILGKFPITEEQFGGGSSLMAFTAVDDDEIVGFFTMRVPDGNHNELRFGFVIVNPEKRGKGYGKAMLTLGLKYAKEIYCAEKASLGVFENNPNAYYCYKAVGFCDSDKVSEEYEVLGEKWKCRELEVLF